MLNGLGEGMIMTEITEADNQVQMLCGRQVLRVCVGDRERDGQLVVGWKHMMYALSAYSWTFPSPPIPPGWRSGEVSSTRAAGYGSNLTFP